MTTLRKQHLEQLKSEIFDVLIIGGGINGAVSAAALAARGLKVALVEKKDFASFTSQESSSLVWGGLKYLEHLEFSLVRNLCVSRNHLLKHYPSSVKEIRFFCPHEKANKHSLLKLYAGVWLYWLMGSGFTQIPRLLSKKQVKAEEPKVCADSIDGGFEYSDAILPDGDARFVFSFIKLAYDSHATISNYTEVTSLAQKDGLWEAQVTDVVNQEKFSIRSKIILNAAGPYVDQLNAANQIKTQTHHLFSKGIHLIVKKIPDHPKVLTFMADDKRMFFILPMGDVSCVGTTDTRVEQIPAVVTDEDRAFVLQQINKRLDLEKPLTEADIIVERCGVRPLALEAQDKNTNGKDFLALSRKHVIEVQKHQKYICIFGGKLTDCVNVGEEMVEIVKKMGLVIKNEDDIWYGEPSQASHEEFLKRAKDLRVDELASVHANESTVERIWRRYGKGAVQILDDIQNDPAMSDVLNIGTGLTRAEVVYSARHEMILTLEDFLRRRTNIAMTRSYNELKQNPDLLEVSRILFGDQAQAKVDEYFKNYSSAKLPGSSRQVA